MERASLLRSALRLNAAFSISTGWAAVALADRVEAMLQLPAVALTTLGALLGGYAAGLVALSLAGRVATAWTVGVTALDLTWVVGSMALAAFHGVPASWLVFAVAAVVLTCALLQLEGLRRATFTRGRGHFEIERGVDAPVERTWTLVSDVARYAEFAGTLHKSEVLSGEGLGLIRRCVDKGVCWVERCVRWEPGRAYAFEVDTSAPGYPLPLRTMRGDFEVERVSGTRSTIRIRFTFTARGGPFTELYVAVLFALDGARVVSAILRRWAECLERPA